MNRIDLGELLGVVAALVVALGVAGAAAYANLNQRVTALETRMEVRR